MSPNQGSRVLFGSGSSPRVQHRTRSAHQLCSAHGVQPRLWYEKGNEVQGLRKHYEEEWEKKKKKEEEGCNISEALQNVILQHPIWLDEPPLTLRVHL